MSFVWLQEVEKDAQRRGSTEYAGSPGSPFRVAANAGRLWSTAMRNARLSRTRMNFVSKVNEPIISVNAKIKRN
jgi:hypothetical protein